MRHIRTRDYNALIESKLEDYDEAMDEKFNDEFRDFLCDEEFIMNPKQITYDDIQGFLDSFEQPDELEWAQSEVESELQGFEDSKYEAFKDQRMGV